MAHSSSVPAAVRSLQPRLQTAGLRGEFDTTLATLMRSLVVSTQGGVYLLSGSALTAYAGWVLDGMDIGSRLIVNLPVDHSPTVVRSCFDIDLRISGHVQSVTEFVEDVASHRFAMIAVDCELFGDADDNQALHALVQMIDSGGWLVLHSPTESQLNMLRQSDEANWCLTTGLGDEQVTLACRRAVAVNNRRGGRRGRLRAAV